MKKLIIAALLVVGMTTFAQEKSERPKKEKTERRSPEERQDMMLKKMTTDLNLDAKQQEQVSQLMGENSSKREARQNANKEQRLAERDAMDAKMKGILTPEQYEKWKTNKENRKEKVQGKRKEKKK